MICKKFQKLYQKDVKKEFNSRNKFEIFQIFHFIVQQLRNLFRMLNFSKKISIIPLSVFIKRLIC